MSDLTEKELGMLEDELEREQNLTRKCRRYAEMCEDPQLKTRCRQLAEQHQDHFNSLLGNL